jgi:hypothetical protein
MGKVGTEWQMGVGDLAQQNGVLLNWETTTTDNEPRIVVANGSLANPVFLVDREGDVTVRGDVRVDGNTTLGDALGDEVMVNAGTVKLPNIPSGSAATEVLVWNSLGSKVERRAASGLISGFAWMLGGNTLTSEQTLGTLSAHDLPIITAGTERVRITQAGHVLPGLDNAYDLGSATRRWSSGYFGTQVKVGTSVSLVAATNELAYTGGDGRISVAGASALRVSTNGFERLRVTATGEVVVQNQAAGTPTTVLRVLGGGGGAGATQVVLQAGAGQSGVDLLQWRNNSGDPLGVIRHEGSVVLVYDPPAREAFFGVAKPSGALLIGIGPEASGGWGVGVYDDATGQLRAGMGKVGTEWQMGVGSLAQQNGVLLNWETTTTDNEPRIVVANGSLANPVFLVDREGDVTVRGDVRVDGNTTLGDALGDEVMVNAGTVKLPNIPSGSAATEVLVWNSLGSKVERRAASGLISGFAWMLGGNTLTSEQTLGTLSAHDLPIITAGTERVRITQAGHVLPGLDNAYDLGSATRRWSSGYFGTQVKVGTSVSLVAATNELAYTGGDGRISVAGASALRVSTNGFERLRVTATGEVVVQNQDPLGTPTTTVLRVLGGNNGAGATKVIIRAGANQAGVGENLLEWQDNSGTILGVIDPDGLVGIGTDRPVQKLHVVGTGTASAVFVEGGVGVGTENPLATLHVYDEGTLTPGATKVIIQAGANQGTENLLEWQNNGGLPLGFIRHEGSVVLVYDPDPPARQAFFAVADPSGVPLIGIGPNLSGDWGVAVYEPNAPFGDLRAGMGKVGTQWQMGVGDLAQQNGVLLNWETTTTDNEPRIVVANGSLANPVFLVDREGDVTVRGDVRVDGNTTLGDALGDEVMVNAGTVKLPNIPSGSAATEVLVWNSLGSKVERRAASGLISGFAWMLGGNTLTSEQTLGTLSAHDLPIITAGTERVRITQAGHVLPGLDNAYDLGSATRRWSSGYFGTQVKVGTSVSLVAATNELAYTGGDGRISVAGASALRVSTNGFERLRVKATGEVVVQNQAAGTPTTVLQVLGGNNGAGATQVVLQAGAGQGWGGPAAVAE